MPNVEKQRERLISLLKELFQLDQPDLDFGFYRIMHAKAGQVTKFLEEDLLGIIREAFGEADEARVAEARAAYEAARKQAVEYGAPDPDATEPVKKAKAVWDAAKDSGSNEGDVYDHLYRFFERYYDNGDFMSRRYFARETDGKAAPYAVPYDGREVYLHWANRDQYYIKTSEYLTNFTFDPTQAKEFQAHHGALVEQKPLKVHCRIVSASEGEHNNVKASEQTERYFIIHEPEPVKIETGDTGEPELVIQFQYRPDPEKTGQEGTWRKKRLAEAADMVKALLPKLDGADDYVTALMTPAPTEAEKDRTLLEKYLAQYTARNTMDYFIHKDLGGFLRRELDFYIKNEVMRLDDIESADAPRVETYLAKIKVLRRIAHHLIDFLAQLEDFQKRLWLKKKFVVDTQYCITLDRIPEEFYPEIAANKAQLREWIELFCVDELDGFQEPPSQPFLKNNPGLFVDTAFFEEDFKDRLLSRIDTVDEEIDGILVHSNNSHSSKAALKKYSDQIKCIYNDPPYNTSEETFVYKNNYKHASWLSMLLNTTGECNQLLSSDGGLIVTIDDEELYRLKMMMDSAWGEIAFVGNVVVETNPRGRGINNFFATSHDYALFFAKSPDRLKIQNQELTDEQAGDFKFEDENSAYRLLPFRRSGGLSTPDDRPNSEFCLIYDEAEKMIVAVGGERSKPYPAEYEPKAYFLWDRATSQAVELSVDEFAQRRGNSWIEIMPVDSDGERRVWRWSDRSKILEAAASGEFVVKKNGSDYSVQLKDRIKDGRKPKTVWSQPSYDGSSHGTNLLKAMMGGRKAFGYPKSLYATKDALHCIVGRDKQALIADFFAGSGTTAHAVIALNRHDGGKRKYILSEMGGYFDAVTRYRVEKAAYSSSWQDGKPVSRDSLSHAFKYLRLESYEDCLNNLTFLGAPKLSQADQAFARDYMLRYWLDFETKGSPSLLNIEWFDDPTAYKLKIKKPGTDEYVEKAVDLVETFNWLIGLHVEHLDRWRGYDAAFKREVDPELPEDTNTRLMLDGALKETDDGAWRFRKVEGYTLRTPGDHNDREKVLVVWRKLTGDLEQDNLMLDEWFRKYRLSAQDTEFDVIYVNGSNNLPNLRKDEETWKVRLIEEAFHQAMWDVEG